MEIILLVIVGIFICLVLLILSKKKTKKEIKREPKEDQVFISDTSSQVLIYDVSANAHREEEIKEVETDDSNRDDSYLYLADGYYYMDGDEDNVNVYGLFRADGQPATLEDFKKRYWTEPPAKWASQFPEYKNYKLSPIKVIDDKQAEAERLIREGYIIRNKKLESDLLKLRPFLNKDQVHILDSIKVYNKGLSSLNGYAGSEDGERYIVLHAGLDVILSQLGTFISNIVWRKSHMTDPNILGSSMISLAKFIGSYGKSGEIEGAWKPQTADKAEEIASAIKDALYSIQIRNAQVQWILAHECSHHIFGHLEQIEKDKKRCNNTMDLEHYSLRQRLEFEADREATKILLNNEEINLTLESIISVIDHLLSFMCFADSVLKIEYNDRSTHPSSKSRLNAYRKYIHESGNELSNNIYFWQSYLNKHLEI